MSACAVCGCRWGIHLPAGLTDPTGQKPLRCVGGCGCTGYTPSHDRNDEPITWAGCECDEGRACNYPPCVMEQDLEARYWGALFAQQQREREDTESYIEQMWQAGRGHLVMAEADFYYEASA